MVNTALNRIAECDGRIDAALAHGDRHTFARYCGYRTEYRNKLQRALTQLAGGTT